MCVCVCVCVCVLPLQLDNPKDYASKVFTLMRIALGQDPAEPPVSQTNGVSSGQEQLPQVEAEVVDPNDPWKSKK